MKKSVFHPHICLLCLLLAMGTSPARAIEMRCGWIVNPTPGNWFLDDRDASWEIMLQGGREPRGMDAIGDISAGDYVATNGYYGYGCACLSGAFNKAGRKVTRITAFRQLALATCRRDPRLKFVE